MFFLSSVDISKLAFSYNFLRNTISDSNSFEYDLAIRFVGPDLGQNLFVKAINRIHMQVTS